MITAGDSAELDLRLFNKDSIWHRLPNIHWPKFDKEWPLLDGTGKPLLRLTVVQATDSEGKPIWEEDSEGKLVPVMIPTAVPVYPHDMPIYDSEGREIYGWFPTPEGLHRWGDWKRPEPKANRLPDRFPFKLPSGFHQLQEEIIWDEIKFVVTDLVGNTVLEKYNDEYPNSIFLDKEDTINLERGLYLYYIIWTTEKDTEREEVQTVVDGN